MIKDYMHFIYSFINIELNLFLISPNFAL